jgi:site-specific recombinase XerC
LREDKVQLSVTGKGGKVRQVLLPKTVSKSLRALRGDAGAKVQATLGHANVATTSGYLHARPNTSSGLKLDEGIFR